MSDETAAPGTPGRPPASAGMMLPARVERAIRATHDESERMIGWFQLGIVIFFALFYLLAPPPADHTLDPRIMGMLSGALIPFVVPILAKPVPWALAVYFVATVVRLVWSTRARLPGWSLVVSIVIDVLLLMGLIWSFHIQYEQPPAFYLKAPTLMYVFIFIALRALRFEERYVLIAGLVAALGWLALVAYAALFDGHGAPVTHNYVEYMSRPLILWGAEIDKVVTIVLVSVLLFLAIRNARRVLVRAVAEGEAAHDLKRFFSDDVAEHITAADERVQPGQGRLCQASILFLDLRGFTALSRTLPPDQTVAVLGDYQARMVPIVRAHGGSVDKFLGDGILASFGAARPSPTHAADALRAVDAVMAEARAWSEECVANGMAPVNVGAAVASGEVLFGAVGDATRLEYTVIGDAVNLAAKLEKQNKAEKVRALTDAATYRLARQQGFSGEKQVRLGCVVGGVEHPLDLAVLS
jgi:adenylate cyclase